MILSSIDYMLNHLFHLRVMFSCKLSMASVHDGELTQLFRQQRAFLSTIPRNVTLVEQEP